jgi:hypothetical protein
MIGLSPRLESSPEDPGDRWEAARRPFGLGFMPRAAYYGRNRRTTGRPLPVERAFYGQSARLHSASRLVGTDLRVPGTRVGGREPALSFFSLSTAKQSGLSLAVPRG